MHVVAQAAVFVVFIISVFLLYRIIYNKSSKNLLAIGAFSIVCMFGQLEGLSATSAQTAGWAMRTVLIGYLLYTTAGTFLMCRLSDTTDKVVKHVFYVITAVFMAVTVIDDAVGPFILIPREPSMGIFGNAMQYDILPLGFLIFAYFIINAVVQLRYGFVVCRQTDRPVEFTVSSLLLVLPFIAYIMNKMGLTGGMDFGTILQLICLIYVYHTVNKLHLWEDEVDARKKVLESSDCGYVVIDQAHNVVMANELAVSMFPGLNINGEKGLIVELLLLHDNDILNHEGRFYDVTVKNIEENGTLTGYCVWVYDCTEKQKMIGELDKVKEDIIESNKMSELLAYHMTNGLGAPIGVIKDRSDAVYNDESTTADAKEMTLEVLDAAQRLEDMVTIMLDYGEVLKSDFEHESHDYSVTDFAEKFGKLLELRKIGRCREVALELDKNTPSVLKGCDDNIINVVESLLRSISMATTPMGIKATIATDSKGGSCNLLITIDVDDNGKTTAEFNRISIMRERGTESINTEINNIPYSQTRKLLKEVDGSVAFTVVDNHSIIELKVPEEVVDGRTVAESEAVESQGAASAADEKVILIVDDNMLYLRQMSSWLKKLGVSVLTAKSGRDCLHTYGEQRVDMIFMDQMMPEMDGTETLQRIRRFEEENKMEKTPVVLLTADDTDGALAKYLEIGFDGYLSKPIQPHQITEKVRFFLG
ncbi:MAG: response regulator [Lachnospiraceae bacterium]|nr:response regulator [Lachnospiraceae bacterium]